VNGVPGEPSPEGAGPRRRLRRRLPITLGLLALLLLLIVLLPRSRPSSTSLPPGRWGRTIACLQRNQSYAVLDVRGRRTPDASTRAVIVRSTVRRQDLAELRDAGSSAAAQAVVRGNRLGQLRRGDYRTFGAVVWAYVENGDPPHVIANAGDKTLIAFCVRTPRR
jgi:hypothetical protein